MHLTPHQKTVILSVAAQAPIMLLLVIFFHIPGLPVLYRAMAVITVILEAALLMELFGNIVQKVRPDHKGIVIREVFERKRVPWGEVRGVRQVIVSPLRSNVKLPSKLFLVKANAAPGLEAATHWWRKHGPSLSGRTGMAGLAKRYDEHVAKHLKGWFVLWSIDYRRAQEHVDEVEVEYLALDGRERGIVGDLQRFGGARARTVDLVDLTYPSFVKRYGGKYAQDTEHVWETVD